MYEESSTDKQTDTPSSTPSTIAMCISDDDEKSDKTIPNDDSTTYSTLDNDRPAATIPEDETNDYNSESEKSVSSNAVSSLSTEAVRETDSRVGDRNSSVCSSPTLENITDGPEIAVEEELRLDNVNQKSLVDDIVASSNMNLSAYGILDVANDNPENGMELRTITDIHCSPVLSVDIQVPVENLSSVGSADFVDTDSKMSHSVTYISNIEKSPNVTLSASDVEKVLDKKVDLSSNSAAQAKKVNKSHTSSNLKELVHELLDPVINNLNNGSITSKIQFIHKLLSVLAHAAMTRVSNTIRNRIAMELYRHWSQQLQVNVSEPNFSSTPYCYNSKTPVSILM
ncbi:Bromodomain-containing protein isoform 1 [Schistosoma japonicum]|uniref:Bromodomain-containing protein isoform 1 n=1 Tax=Schistosoma japonicum TaxID=6182 RepID=A0A4Z2DV96_SCHJA|nr:Bromodomain-containing protein isoform 1 [Schistosoma japonicum]